MVLQLKCEHCSASLRVDAKLAGKRGKCPKCGGAVKVPAAEAAVTAASAVMHPAAAAEHAATASERASAAVPGKRESAEAPPLAATSSRMTAASPDVEQRVLAAFQGAIAPVRRPLSYRLGVALAALVMVLLPLLYVGLICLVAYGVYLHAIYNITIFDNEIRGRGQLMVVVVYLAPMVIGGILVLFMIKPFFARPSGDDRTRSLTRESEPLLFAFVDRVCQAVHAPRPKCIDVDGEVNASARFRRGMLSFLGNDLVLTIGMPLVLGLNLRQFAGVLAHEFGHFSQGAGMRLTYVVRTISYWFSRVVYERDEWDEWLHSTARAVDLRVGWVLFLAQAMVWFTRKILWVLMYIGHLVSVVLMRDMEFDADRHEARLAGSETFASTSRRMRELSAAMYQARSDLGDFYREGRLIDNLPKLMHAKLTQIPAEAFKKMHAANEETHTGWFDTHPCDRDRIASAQREQASGIFQLELPATCLFRDADRLAQEVTVDFYHAVLGSEVKPSELHPVEQLLTVQDRDKEAYEALNRLFHEHYNVMRPVTLDVAPRKGEPSELLNAARAAADRASTLAAEYEKLSEQFGAAFKQWLAAEHALALADAGLTLNKKIAPEGVTDSLAAAHVKKTAEEQMAALNPLLANFEAAAANHVDAGLGLLFSGPSRSDDEQLERRRAKCRRLFPAWHALQRVFDTRLSLQLEFVRLAALCSQLDAQKENEGFVNKLLKQMERTADRVNALREQLGDVAYPFDHAKTETTLADFVRSEPLLDKRNLGEIYQAAESALECIHQLTARTLAHLAQLAESATARS